MSTRLAERGVRLALLDIEGTTTPLAFVHDILFPFAGARLAAWLAGNDSTADYGRLVSMLQSEREPDEKAGETLPTWSTRTDAECLASVQAYLEWLMARDRKSPALKLVQGWIWEAGYQAGELHGEIFPDVAPALRRWRTEGVVVAIYSSGSELAQRRLFASTGHGDLTPLIAGFFDTAVGPKLSASSYRRIADAMGCPPGAAMFISDVAGELQAAQEAGCRVILSIRPGNAEQPDPDRFERFSTFEAL
ncbi:MAG: acireductone synthase [Vicinamibacterales bacterium]